MHLTELRVENVRGIPGGDKGLDLNLGRSEVLPRWVVIAGRNGSGKTTLLQAIAVAIAGPSVARLLAETFSGWIRDGESSAQAGVRVRFNDDDGFAAGRKPTFDPWAAIAWERADGPEPVMQKASGFGGNWTPARGPWAENPRGWFIAGYGPFRRLSPAPADAQRLMMLPGRPAALASLFREDASLSESIAWLQQLYLQRLEGRPEAEETEQLVLRLLDDGLLPEGMRVRKIDSVGLWVDTPEGQDIPLSALSDGYRTVAGLVLDLVKQLLSSFGQLKVDRQQHSAGVTVENEGVVLIDEVDVHLHVEWQKRIGFWLKNHFPNIQFIVTTHSPFICQAADPGGLVRLSPSWQEGPAAEIVTGEVFNRVVNGTLDEAVLSDLFGLDTTLSDKAKDLRERVAQLEGKAMNNALGRAESSELLRLVANLPSSQSEDVLRIARALLVNARS